MLLLGIMKNLQLGLLIIIFSAGLAHGGSFGETDQPVAGHESPDCRQCHLKSSSAGAELAAASNNCLSCHSTMASSKNRGLGFHGNQAQDRCLQCHSYHQPEMITTTRGTIDLGSLAQVNEGHCLSCHDGKGSLNLLSEAHLAAATLYHEQASSLKGISPSQGCLNCHSNNTATAWQLAYDGDVLEFSEHATHPFEVEVIPGQGSYAHRIRREIDPRIPLFEQTIQCQTCHQLTAETPDLILAFDEATDLCLGCHQFREKPATQPDQQLAVAVSR